MRTMVQFMRHVMQVPMPWRVWVAVLFLTNMAAVAFLPRPEAWVVLAALGVGALAQMVLFARFGFVRLLGAGHVHWIPMVMWLYARLDGLDEAGFRRWVMLVGLLCLVSVVIDLVDLARYAAGDRGPTVPTAAEGR